MGVTSGNGWQLNAGRDRLQVFGQNPGISKGLLPADKRHARYVKVGTNTGHRQDIREVLLEDSGRVVNAIWVVSAKPGQCQGS